MSPENERKFKSAQWRFILCSMIAYAFFYVTRKNLSMAQPGMLEEKVISTYALGTIMTVHGVLYGLSLSTTRADMLRAVMEGIVFSLTQIVDLYRSFVPVEAVIASGGGAASRRVLPAPGLEAGLILDLGFPSRSLGLQDTANVSSWRGWCW